MKYSIHSQNRRSEETDLQGISNNVAESFHRWREVYFDVALSRLVRVKLGKVDANTEFAVIENGADFSNAAIGVSPTLFTMPSYPNGGASANAFVTPAQWLSLAVGVYRTPGGSRYSVAEGGGRWAGNRPGRLAAGYWNQTAGASEVGAMPKSSGAYVVGEQTILPLGGDTGLRAFARFSTAEEITAPARSHTAYGLTWTGVRSREADSVGLAVLDLRPSAIGLTGRSERAVEIYYLIAVNRHFAIKMDVQHIRQPSGTPDSRPLTVASVRLLVNLSTAAPQ